MEKIFIRNYGCSANYNHGQIMAGLLAGSGFETVDNAKDADIIIINSCIVKSVTENKIKSIVKQFLDLYPNKKVIIAGCGADAESEIFKR
ncbi:MAG: threonylcarbamoyladenosine tRNA methylthiotransferase, partial [Candidatus Micrarchaeota archaeon]|nr:threonylcarbamoyladenosine tRNA methylthiotransferase [Candidatus Micrarchaeota archaeon]